MSKKKDKIIQIIGQDGLLFGLSESGNVYYINAGKANEAWIYVIPSPFPKQKP